MPVNVNPERVSEADLRSNQRGISAHLDDQYYRRSFTPSAFVVSLGANHGTAGASSGAAKWPTIEFPDGADTYAFIAFERPKLWVTGKLKLTIYYSSDAGSTNNFGLLTNVVSVPEGGNLSDTGVTVLLSDASPTNVAGPAAAEGEQSVDVYTTTSFDPSARRIGVRIGRKGTTDANANVFLVTEVVVQHIPAKQQVDVQ